MTRNVPCDGCTACCQEDLILLHPEMGDNAEEYQTIRVTVNGREEQALAHKKNGECIYLGEKGCTIHTHAPAICREFDCRDLWRRTSRSEPPAMDCGRARLKSGDGCGARAGAARRHPCAIRN